jgi:DNA polymerase phi
MLIISQACISATTHMFTSESKMSEKSSDTGLISEPIDVLVDAIIGLLEQSTAYLRSVANLAFTLLSSIVQ